VFFARPSDFSDAGRAPNRGSMSSPHPIRRPYLTEDVFLRSSTWAREQLGTPLPAD
jgi:hypothetical protein